MTGLLVSISAGPRRFGTWLRGHKSETVSLLISISLSVKEYIEEKWDWDQKWDRLAFMAPEPEAMFREVGTDSMGVVHNLFK